MLESWSPSIKDAVRGGTVNLEPLSRVPGLGAGGGAPGEGRGRATHFEADTGM